MSIKNIIACNYLSILFARWKFSLFHSAAYFTLSSQRKESQISQKNWSFFWPYFLQNNTYFSNQRPATHHYESLQLSTMLRNLFTELGLVRDFAADGGLGVCAVPIPSVSPLCCKLAAGILPTLTRFAERGTGPLAVLIVICVGVIASISARVGELFKPSGPWILDPDLPRTFTNWAELLSLVLSPEDSCAAGEAMSWDAFIGAGRFGLLLCVGLSDCWLMGLTFPAEFGTNPPDCFLKCLNIFLTASLQFCQLKLS